MASQTGGVNGGNSGSGSNGGDAEAMQAPPPNSFAALCLAIYDDLISNALHEVVLEAHRSEKLLRMQQIQLAAAAEAAKAAASGAQDKPPEQQPPQQKPLNPLATLPKEIICPKCKLPRHTAETLANGLPSGKEEKKKYCPKLPYQNRSLHDIYGNPFPTVSAAAKKKAKAAAAAVAAAAAAAAESRGSPDSTSAGNVGVFGDNGPIISIPSGRKPDALVYYKCTCCGMEKIEVSKYAAHLEKCMGFAGRKSSRAAMAKMSAGSGAGSPAVSGDLGSGAGGRGSRKPTPDVNDAMNRGIRGGYTEEGINVPPPPAPSNTTGKPYGALPKKKKKAAAAKDNGYALAEESRISQAENASVVTAPTSTPVPRDVPQKKRKRKVDAATNGDAAVGDAVLPDERDTSIIVAPPRAKPLLKKQKLEAEAPGPLKKSQISKFKDRESPGPGMGNQKKSDVKVGVPPPAPPMGGKYPPGIAARNTISSPPPPQPLHPAKAISPAPLGIPNTAVSYGPSGSPKVTPTKLGGGPKGTKKMNADGTPMRKGKSSQGVSSAQTTPKIAKKALPGVGVNVPAPAKIAGKTLPKLSGQGLSGSPRKEKLSNGTPKKKMGGVGMQRQGSVGVPGVAGKTVPGKRAPPTQGLGAGAGAGANEAGVPRKRPKVGE